MYSDTPSTDLINSISLLRDSLLPNLLKEDEEEILYWAGKELARTFTFENFDALTQRVSSLFSGNLEEIKKSKHTVSYSYSGPLIQSRFTSRTSPSFSLEAGFLAEAHQRMTGTYTEATYDSHVKQSSVTFFLQSDHHVSLNDQ